MWDEYDPIAPDLVLARPDDDPLADTVRAILREPIGGLYRRDPKQLLLRTRLLTTVPELRAQMLAQQGSASEQLATLLARKRHLPSDDLAIRVIAGAFGAAIITAIDAWQADNGKSALLELVDRAIDARAHSMQELNA